METESLFYKEHNIDGNDITVIFHKDVTYILNELTPNPIVNNLNQTVQTTTNRQK